MDYPIKFEELKSRNHSSESLFVGRCSPLSHPASVDWSMPKCSASFFCVRPCTRRYSRMLSPKFSVFFSNGSRPRKLIILGIWAKEGWTLFFSQRYIVMSETLNLRESWRLVSLFSILRALIQSPHVSKKSGIFSL